LNATTETRKQGESAGDGPVARAVGLGLGLGMLGGAVTLMVLALRPFVKGVDCEGLSPAECTLEQDVILSLARMQGLTGLALAMMALAIALVLRAKARSTPHRSGGSS
jgi:hypothetical protein